MLKKSIITLILFVLLIGISVSFEYSSRIYKGNSSVRGQFPYFVFLDILKPNDGGFCGGSLLTNQFILTAAHCVINATKITIHLGAWESYNQFEYTRQTVFAYSDNVIMHPNFDFMMAKYDVALIKLQASIQFTDYIQPIRLMNKCQPLENMDVTVIGNGQVSHNSEWPFSTVLQYARLKIISTEKCKKDFPRILSDHMFCAASTEYRSVNIGDSGGPVVTDDNKLIGVTSHIHRDGCNKGKPQVFINILAVYDFISKETGLRLPKC